MKCPSCGTEADESAKFCGVCGAPLPSATAAPASPFAEPASSPNQTNPQQAGGAPAAPASPYAQQAGAQPASPYGQAQYQPGYVGTTYPMTDSDKTLRLINFILCLITTIVCAIAIIPLAWMIPMTVISWGIYKGTKRNTVAFGVCTLLFVSVIGGILLLCSTKNE